jgi:indole-3-acetate monooxygenase
MQPVEHSRGTALVEAAQELAPGIRAAADQIEAERRLPPALVQAMADAGLFRMALPAEFGGAEADPITMTQVVETLARADASAAWCVMIAWHGITIAMYFPRQTVAEAFGHDPLAVMAGAVQPRGRAVVAPGGYRVQGRWPFASGSLHARWLSGNAAVYEADGVTPRLDAAGQPVTRIMLAPAEQCRVLDTWTTMGLRGTGSHDVIMDDLFVPDDYTASLTDPSWHPNPMYRVVPVHAAGHGGHALGVASAALAAALELASTKVPRGSISPLQDQAPAQTDLARAEALLESGRAFLYSALRDLWTTAAAAEEPTMAQRARARLATSQAVANAVAAVDLLYALGGTTSIYATSPLDRAFRDLHTAAAHGLVNRGTFAAAGRVLLGMPPAAVFF